MHKVKTKKVVHSEKFPIDRVHRFAPLGAKPHCSPCCASLILHCVWSIHRSIGKAHANSSIGSHAPQLRSRVKIHDRLHTTLCIFICRFQCIHTTHTMYVSIHSHVQQIHFVKVGISHIRNRNDNAYQSQDFGSVSANYRLPNWH